MFVKFLTTLRISTINLSEKQLAAIWYEYQDWVNLGLVEGQTILQTARDFQQSGTLDLGDVPTLRISELLRGYRDNFQAMHEFAPQRPNTGNVTGYRGKSGKWWASRKGKFAIGRTRPQALARLNKQLA